MKTRAPFKTTSSEELRFCCPRCYDANFHLYYNPGKSVFNCFKCGYSGHGFPRELEYLVLPEIPQHKKERKQKEFNWIPLQHPPRSALEAVVWDYLLNTRKLSIQTVLDFHCGWNPDAPFAVALPIIMHEKIQALQVRFLTKSFAKYVFYSVNTHEVKKSALIYNYDRVSKGVDTLYVMEGIFDVMCSDPSQSICTFGKLVSFDQALLIRAIPKKKLVLAYDPEVKLEELQRSIERLEAFEPVYIKLLPPDQDPADLGPRFHACPELTFLEFAETKINV